MAGHVRQRGDKWQAIAAYRDGTGKLVQLSSTHSSKAQANAAMADLLKRAGSQDRPTAKGTLNDLLDAWWEVKSPRWGEETRRMRKSMLNRHVRPSIGKMKLKALNPYDFELYFAKAELGEHARLVIYRTLHAAMECGKTWGWLAKNPIEGARPKEPKQRRFSPPEVEDILKLIGAIDDEWFELYIRLAICSGARRGDLCKLQWSHIDWHKGRVLIEGEKTDNPHEISLGPDMMARLISWHDRIKARGGGDWVFSTNPWHRSPVSLSHVSHKFRAVADSVGLTLRLHDLRHTNATWLLGAGDIPVATVSYRLGHSKTSITNDIYNHRIPTDDVRAAEFVDGLLSGS